MFTSKTRHWLAAVAVVFAVLVIGGCGGNDEPNNPSGGGGGTLELNSPTLGNAGVYVHTFPATLKTYNYHCKIHGAAMSGSVIVQAGGAAAANVSITDNAFSGPVTIGPSGTVTWTNNGSNSHTVTSN